nr:HPr(Ser) kinase/phosphatase [bacterium]
MIIKNAETFAADLGLEILCGRREMMRLSVSDLNRPGLQLAGWSRFFQEERVQVIGAAEAAYLEQLSEDTRLSRMEHFLAHPIPCVVICRGLEVPGLAALAQRVGRPVFRTDMRTTPFMHRIIAYLDRELAPSALMHGVLVDAYGVGVLLMGRSGIGKSETALELIKRGHRLVADDAVQVRKMGDTLVGEAPPAMRYLMEIRGIGLINVRTMYGISSVIDSRSVDLVMQLDEWDNNREYERLGDKDETMDILGTPVPCIQVPVSPGRNLAMLVEVAARHYRLKGLGEIGALDLKERMSNQIMAQKAEHQQ